MHDWVLENLHFDWKAGDLTLSVNTPSGIRFIQCKAVSKLLVPRVNDWGPSVHINQAIGPTVGPDNSVEYNIEMQSGDVIEIICREVIADSQ